MFGASRIIMRATPAIMQTAKAGCYHATAGRYHSPQATETDEFQYKTALYSKYTDIYMYETD